jgi:3-phenylpropionate/trans-cinnamate dioxygenase alpha subunit
MQVMNRNVQQKMGDSEFNREGLYEVSPGQQFTSPLGHGSGWFDRRIGSLSLNPEIAEWENSRRDETLERLGERRALSVRGHGNIFPNFMFLMNNTFRVTHPRGPGEMEIWAWTLVPKAAPDEVKEQYRINVLRTFSPGGMFEQDDAENWLEIQRILRGHMARKGRLNYRMQLGATARDVDDLPGLTTPHCYSDAGARGLYRHWARLLSGMTWAEIMRLADEAQGSDHEAPAADALGQSHPAKEESRG